jgi:hypothetical protein
MNLLNILVIIGSLALLNGCSKDPLVQDFDVPLVQGYHLISTDVDDVEVAMLHPRFSSCIPAKVVEVGWNTNFIVAKQQELRNRGDFPGDTLPVPVAGKFSFWIIDLRGTNCFGPMTEADYYSKLQTLGQSPLQMRQISKLR